MTKNRTPTPVYLDPGMHPGLEVKGLNGMFNQGMNEMFQLNRQVHKYKTRASDNRVPRYPEMKFHDFSMTFHDHFLGIP